MNIFKKSSELFVNDVAQYAGKSRGAHDGLDYWEVNDSEQEPFKSILEAVSSELSRCRSIPRSANVQLDIFVRGKSLQGSSICVMLAGCTTRQLRAAVKRLKRSDLTTKYNGLLIDHWPSPPDMPNIFLAGTMSESGNSNLVYSCADYDIQKHTIQGTAEHIFTIETRYKDSEYNRRGVISGLVVKDQQAFFIVPAHTFISRQHKDSLEEWWSAWDCGSESDSDTDSNSLHDSDPRGSRAGSVTPTDFASLRRATSTESGFNSFVYGQTSRSSVALENLASSDAPQPSSSPFENPLWRSQSLYSFSLEHDYAMLLAPESQTHWSELPQLHFDCIRKVLPGEIRIALSAPSCGTMEGILQGRSTLMRLPHSSHFSRVYPVTLTQSISEGDSGSIVIDPLSREIYGIVVAGSKEATTAFILPAFEVLQHINDTITKSQQTRSTSVSSPPRNSSHSADVHETSQMVLREVTTLPLYQHSPNRSYQEGDEKNVTLNQPLYQQVLPTNMKDDTHAAKRPAHHNKPQVLRQRHQRQLSPSLRTRSDELLDKTQRWPRASRDNRTLSRTATSTGQRMKRHEKVQDDWSRLFPPRSSIPMQLPGLNAFRHSSPLSSEIRDLLLLTSHDSICDEEDDVVNGFNTLHLLENFVSDARDVHINICGPALGSLATSAWIDHRVWLHNFTKSMTIPQQCNRILSSSELPALLKTLTPLEATQGYADARYRRLVYVADADGASILALARQATQSQASALGWLFRGYINPSLVCSLRVHVLDKAVDFVFHIPRLAISTHHTPDPRRIFSRPLRQTYNISSILKLGTSYTPLRTPDELYLVETQSSCAISVLNERWWDIFSLQEEFYLPESKLEVPSQEDWHDEARNTPRAPPGFLHVREVQYDIPGPGWPTSSPRVYALQYLEKTLSGLIHDQQRIYNTIARVIRACKNSRLVNSARREQLLPLSQQREAIDMTQSVVLKLQELVSEQDYQFQAFLRNELGIDTNSTAAWRIRAPLFSTINLETDDFDAKRWCTKMQEHLCEVAEMHIRVEALLRDCDYLRQENERDLAESARNASWPGGVYEFIKHSLQVFREGKREDSSEQRLA